MNRRLIRLAILNIFLVTVFYNPVASSTNLDRRTQAPTAQTSTSPVTALAFDPSSRFLVSGSEDSTLRLWNVKNSSEIRSVVGHRMAEITGAAVTPDSKTVVTAGRDSVLRVWDFATGRASKILQGHEHAIKALALRPDGKAVAGGGEDTRILVWNTSNGKLTQTLNGHDDFVNSVAFSPDGKTLASGSNDMRVILWDIATQKPRAVLRGHADAVNAVAFSADGSIVASASDDATIRLWDARSGQALATLNGHKGVVTTLAFSPKELMLVSGSADTLVRVWDIRTRKEVRSLQGNVAGISALAFSPDGNAVASGSLDGQVRIWNPGTGKPQQILRGKRQAGTSGGATQRIVPNDTAGSSALAEGTSPFTVAPGATAAQSLANGPGGPILVITSTTNPFGGYYAEILRNEGLNAFATMDIGSVTASTLANYDVVLLSEIGLTGAQVSMFQSWVTAGGNLIAMRPDKQLSGLLGLSDASATLSNGYLLVDSSSSPGNGIVDETIQFHGTADRYTLNGASSIATLYTTASAATTHPAVTLRNTGTNGGQAAAFTYDLARSIVYTRQGNPAWDRQERDGFSPIRSDDLFYGAASGDQQTDWVDLNKAEIPQADEQQRLLVNLILEMNHDKKPFPRFWYFPRGEKAVVVMTGDDHANGGTAGRWDRYKANSPPGCSVQDWECVRGTSYIYPNTPLTNAQAAAYASEGFEVGLHVSTNCSDYTPSSIDADFSSQLITWRAKYSSVPVPTTNRTHCIAYSDWVTQPKIELKYGIRLDTNYYYWPAGWVANRPGFMTGSGMAMRFADFDGSLIDVYQGATQLTDESGQSYPFNVDALLDKALGVEGYYGAIVINDHTDSVGSLVSDAVIPSAQSRSVPIISAAQLLEWIDGRNSSTFNAITWSGNTLSFSVAPGTGARGLQTMVPVSSAVGRLTGITRNGTPVSFVVRVVKGVDYAFVSGDAGNYVATYAPDTTPPTVTSTSPTSGASGVAVGTNVSVSFNEPMDATTITPQTLELRDASNTLVASSVSYDSSSRTATLDPQAPLAPSTTYSLLVKAGSGGVKDVAGNALASPFTSSFATAAPPSCPCSIWNTTTTPDVPATNDGSGLEVGVRFRATVDGSVTGIRFYKGSGNTGTHVGNLWSNTGTRLATATFTSETASGWQTVTFASPVPITANTTYVASYFAPNGRYAATAFQFASSGVVNGPLSALQNGQDGANGVYRYSTTSIFPNQSWQATNYWIDVVFTTLMTTQDMTPPTVTSTSPTSGASGVAVGTNVSVSFNEPMDATTITPQTLELRDASNTLVASSVSYDSSSRTATLDPQAPLAPSTTYSLLVKAGSGGVKDVAGNALASPFTSSFATAAPPSCPCSIWSTTATPAVASESDTGAVELGVRFRATVDGSVTGIRFYKGSGNTGVHVGNLWSNTGTRLATATFTSETASGWQTVTFATPVPVTANTTYVASYFAPNGRYAATSNQFASTGVVNGPLSALQNGQDGANGVYRYSTTSIFPNQSWQATNYWVDVVFTSGAGTPDTTPPTVTSTSPTSGASGVAVGTNVSVSFSEPMDATTLTPQTLELRDASNTLVTSSVSYDSSSRTATLDPQAPLAPSTTYTLLVKAGSGGVKDVAGNALASPFTSSFATAAPPSCPCSIWSTTATPAVAADPETSAVEVGVRFRAAVNGSITGIRFYKGSGNTGVHVGNLWSNTGTRLATATFTSETASGWQTVTFASPVPITANTTYVASYFAPNGRYSTDMQYFATQGVVNGPLSALQNGQDGSNGVYRYGSSSTFPDQSWQATNYWVDVVFTTAP